MNVVGNKKIYLSISAILIIASVVAIATLGLKPGIDFSGGTLWQIQFSDSVSKESLGGLLESTLDATELTISEQGSGLFLLRLSEIDEATHQNYLGQIRAEFGEVEELRFETIGPAISSELRSSSLKVFILVLIAISLYVIFAFRKVSHRLASWRYGLITLVTLFHDAVITIGFFALLGALVQAELDVSIVVAILVTMGFSVHDTIVVFDRIRENLKVEKESKLDTIINKSVKETLARSINTSLTLIFVLAALFFLGAPNLQNFILTIIVGTIIGTYSSIFVASPLLGGVRSKPKSI